MSLQAQGRDVVVSCHFNVVRWWCLPSSVPETLHYEGVHDPGYAFPIFFVIDVFFRARNGSGDIMADQHAKAWP